MFKANIDRQTKFAFSWLDKGSLTLTSMKCVHAVTIGSKARMNELKSEAGYVEVVRTHVQLKLWCILALVYLVKVFSLLATVSTRSRSLNKHRLSMQCFVFGALLLEVYYNLLGYTEIEFLTQKFHLRLEGVFSILLACRKPHVTRGRFVLCKHYVYQIVTKRPLYKPWTNLNFEHPRHKVPFPRPCHKCWRFFPAWLCTCEWKTLRAIVSVQSPKALDRRTTSASILEYNTCNLPNQDLALFSVLFCIVSKFLKTLTGTRWVMIWGRNPLK